MKFGCGFWVRVKKPVWFNVKGEGVKNFETIDRPFD